MSKGKRRLEKKRENKRGKSREGVEKRVAISLKKVTAKAKRH